VASVPGTQVPIVGPSSSAPVQARVGGAGERVEASEDAQEICQAAWTSIPLTNDRRVSVVTPVVVSAAVVEASVMVTVGGASLKQAGLVIPSMLRSLIGHPRVYPLDKDPY